MPKTTKYKSIYSAMKILPQMKSLGLSSDNDIVDLVRHHGGSYMPHTVRNNNLNPDTLMSYQYTENVYANAATDSSYTAEDYSYNEWNLYNLNIFGMGEGYCGPKKDSISVWAYRYPSGKTGRVILCGSHPEREKSGKKLELMETMVKYALAGTGDPVEKGELKLNVPWENNENTGSSQTTHIKIGDKQYHHFTFSASSSAGVKVKLTSSSAANLYLAFRKGDFAWLSDADYVICTSGGNKTLNIKNMSPGTWYLSVYCQTTVSTSNQTGSNNLAYIQYDGNTYVLNGVPYTILIEPLGSSVSQIDSFIGDNVGNVSLAMDY